MLSADVIATIPATRAVGISAERDARHCRRQQRLSTATPTMTFFSARGGPTNEGRMTVNGMTVAAPFNGGGVSTYVLDSVNVDEASVTVGRHGGVGYRRAGDEPCTAHGRQHLPRARRSINNAGEWSKGDNLTDELRAVGLTEPPGIINAYDTSVSYGGPIKRDRLWFFGSYRTLDTATAGPGDRRQCETPTTPRAGIGSPDTSISARQLQGRTMYIGRVTAQATRKDRFTFNYEYQNRCEGSPLKVGDRRLQLAGRRLGRLRHGNRVARGATRTISQYPVLPDSGGSGARR